MYDKKVKKCVELLKKECMNKKRLINYLFSLLLIVTATIVRKEIKNTNAIFYDLTVYFVFVHLNTGEFECHRICTSLYLLYINMYI